MRLLNTHTLELKDFNTGSVPVYAILSHTWEDGEEVTFKELPTRAARNKKGFRKISDFCDEAAARGIDWGWVDTCCIDKTDLVELSLAINSMYAWYRDSAICFAYLSDFQLPQRSRGWAEQDLAKSRWFKRGWTLQELIAPEYLVFYDSRWRPFGTKHELADVVSQVTGISEGLLRGLKSLDDFSCAQKMSWAAFRQTTRVEDRAYSLLGLFNICFPPLYGEGWKAFGRLQEEILKVSMDQSIFAWTQKGIFKPQNSSNGGDLGDWSSRYRCSILAPTPECFHESSSVICARKNDTEYAHPRLASHISGIEDGRRALLNRPTTITNTGLQIPLLALAIKNSPNRSLVEVMLNCCHDYDRESKITIFLVTGVNIFERPRMVPAWRIEPHYLGLAQERFVEVFYFDIHPIHAAWPTSFEVSQSPEMTQEGYNQERQAAKERIQVARGSQIRGMRKMPWLVTAAVVASGLLCASHLAVNSKNKSNRELSRATARIPNSSVGHTPTRIYHYTTPTPRPTPIRKAMYEHRGTVFE
jgi:hypothetical protein